MADVQTKECDVYGTLRAQPYLLTLQVPEKMGANRQWAPDLSDKGLERLVNAIERALQPHVPRKRK